MPLLLWILWTNPRWRIAFLALVAVHAVAAVATGWGDEWIARLATSGSDVGNVFNISPSRLVGPWWLAIGIPLGALLLRAGRIGWSCLAVSPYILPPYLLILLLEQPGLYAEHLTPTPGTKSLFGASGESLPWQLTISGDADGNRLAPLTLSPHRD